MPVPNDSRCMPRSGDQQAGELAGCTGRRDGAIGGDAHHRMPAEGTDRPPDARTPQTAIRADDHRHRRRHRRSGQIEQVQPVGQSCPFLVGGQDMQGDGDRRAAIQDADRQDDDPFTMTGRIKGEGEIGAEPPREEPAQQGRKAERNLPVTLAGDALLVP